MAADEPAVDDEQWRQEWLNTVGEFIIYEIIGRKAGCTNDLQRRAEGYLNQGETRPLQVLEIVVGTPQQAGDREWAWADKLGYPRGPHYTKKNWALLMTKQQRRHNALIMISKLSKEQRQRAAKNANSKLTKEQRSVAGKIGGKKGGKTQGKRNVISGHWERISTKETRSRGGKITGKINMAVRWTCVTHGVTSSPGNIGRWHSKPGCVIAK